MIVAPIPLAEPLPDADDEEFPAVALADRVAQ